MFKNYGWCRFWLICTLKLEHEDDCIALWMSFFVHCILTNVADQPYSMKIHSLCTVNILHTIKGSMPFKTLFFAKLIIWMNFPVVCQVLICFRNRFRCSSWSHLRCVSQLEFHNSVLYYLYVWECVCKKEIEKTQSIPRTTSSVSDYNCAEGNNERERDKETYTNSLKMSQCR